MNHLRHNVETKKMSPAKSPNISGFFAIQTAIFLCTETQMYNRRFPFADRLELSHNRIMIRKADRNQKSICLFYYPQKKEKSNMLQKELAKRLKARYDTKMDGKGWLEVHSDEGAAWILLKMLTR